MAPPSRPQLDLPITAPSAPRAPTEPGVAVPLGLEEEQRLHRRLATALGEPIDLVTTQNRRTLLSWKRGRDGLLRVRLQREFARCDDTVVAGKTLDGFPDPDACAQAVKQAL